MQPTEVIYFTVALFLALAALIKWKRRRDLIAARLNRGLRGYVEAKHADPLPGQGTTHPESLIPA
jgi:hypothetical protein